MFFKTPGKNISQQCCLFAKARPPQCPRTRGDNDGVPSAPGEGKQPRARKDGFGQDGGGWEEKERSNNFLDSEDSSFLFWLVLFGGCKLNPGYQRRERRTRAGCLTVSKCLYFPNKALVAILWQPGSSSRGPKKNVTAKGKSNLAPAGTS